MPRLVVETKYLLLHTVAEEMRKLLGGEWLHMDLSAGDVSFLLAVGMTQRDPSERAGLLRLAARTVVECRAV